MTLQFERGFSLHDAIDILTGADDDILDQVDSIAIAPPDPNVLTDEDSSDEDDGGLVDNLSGKQLLADAEIRLRNNTVISSFGNTDVTNLDEQLPITTRGLGSRTQPDAVHVTTNTENNDSGQNVDDTANGNKKSELLPSLMSEKQHEINAKKKKTPIKRTWIDGDIDASNVCFPEADFSKYKDFSASELFELFFDDEVFDIFVRESAKYALFKNCSNPNISKDELKCFIGILILSGYYSLPGKRNYWDSQPDMHVDFISNTMRRNRFETIMKFLHCADNNELDPKDKMWKLIPLINKVQTNCLDNFVPVQDLSYDESMIQYFGKHGCKQHIKGKPIRFGFKVWCVNTVCGYLVNFIVYQEKSLDMPTEYDLLFGKSAAPLVKCIDEFPVQKTALPYKFYFDNLFTNFYLLKYFMGLGYSGMGRIREDRLPKSCNLTVKKELKNTPRGHFESSLCKEDGILICKWHDNGIVGIATNCHGVQPASKVRRYSQVEKKYIQVDRPSVFGEYNKNIGGTDKMDQHVSTYRIGVRGKKWYWPVLTWIIDVCVQNAWHLRRNSRNKTPQLDFRRELVQCYVLKYGVASKGPGRPISSRQSISNSRVSDELRYDRLDHLVIVTPEKKKKRCAGEGCSSIIRTMCKKCQVGLCLECFAVFHENTY